MAVRGIRTVSERAVAADCPQEQDFPPVFHNTILTLGGDLALSSDMKLPLRVAAALTLFSALAAAQTKITPPKNKYTPAQDVQLGRQAAAEARQQLPVMRDDAVSSYLEDIGRRLTN